MSQPNDPRTRGPEAAKKAEPLHATNPWFTNRVLLGMVAFFLLTGLWEYRWKPQYRPYYEKGIVYYHSGDYGDALNQFQAAYQIDENAVDVIIMMGWTNLKMKRWEEARYYFDRALKIDPRLQEAQMGSSFVALETGRGKLDPRMLSQLLGARKGDPNVRILAAAALEQQGDYVEAAKIYRGLMSDSSYGKAATVAYRRVYGLEGFDNDTVPEQLPPATKASSLQVRYRAADGAYWKMTGGSWEKFYVQGVDLGPGAPGYYPLDPPTRGDLYAGWIHDASQMNANVLRAYTLLPPAFYRAYRHYLDGGGKTTLMQQVWVGEPPNHDLFTPAFVEATKSEIRNVVDVLHGRGVVPPTKEQSSGIYDSDIAAAVSGILVGGQADPVTVSQTNLINGGKTRYDGKYVSVAGEPAEVWYAQMLDYLVDYETSTYNWQHPVAIENGPAHDPTRGQITEEKLRAAPQFQAGLFAAYAVFPYYPEMLTRDAQFLRARDSQGVNPVFGYLRLLRAHTSLPLVVSEYGISTSMGVRHTQVNGWDQGGHAEDSQADLLARLSQTIREVGCAGGIVFELADEWYRQGWMREGFETPADRGMLWLNDLDPNKRYGLIGYRTDNWRLFTGDPAAWEKEAVLYSSGSKPASVDAFDKEREIRSVQAGADEGYLYLRINVGCLDCNGARHDGKAHLDKAAYAIAINTVAGRAGLQSLPFGGLSITSGTDFLLYLGEPAQSRLLVAENYNPYLVSARTDYPSENQLIYRRGFNAGLNNSGLFVSYPAATGVSPSVLHYGSGDPMSKEYNSTAEWYADIKHDAVLVRIPWGKLLVTDPSSLHVFYGYSENTGIRTAVSSGVTVSVFALATNGATDLSQMKVAATAPAVDGGKLEPANFRWNLWNTVAAQPYFKKGYYQMQKEFSGEPAAAAPVKRAAIERPTVVR